jgi:Na+-driven multidrug efflux pump
MMRYFFHAGIALATSISSWLGCIIYIVLLIKSEKLSKPKISFDHYALNIFSIFVYSLKISFVSVFMIFIMKFFVYFLKSYQINEFFTLLIITTLGFSMYILTSSLLSYIPQELLKKNILKFKKDKKV